MIHWRGRVCHWRAYAPLERACAPLEGACVPLERAYDPLEGACVPCSSPLDLGLLDERLKLRLKRWPDTFGHLLEERLDGVPLLARALAAR